MSFIKVRNITNITDRTLSHPNTVHVEKENDKRSFMKSERLFRFVFISLTLVGFSWNPYWGTRNFCIQIFWRTYSLVLIAVYLTMTLVSIPCYRAASSTPEVMLIVSSELLCGLVVLLWFRGLTLSRLTNKFVAYLDELREDETFGKYVNYRKLYKVMSLVVVVWNMGTLFSFPFFVFMLTKDNSMFGKDTCLQNPFGEQSILSKSLEVLSLTGVLYLGHVLNAALCLYVLVCKILIMEFESCTKVFAEMTAGSVGEPLMDTCSRRHAAITRLTDVAATFLSQYVGIGYIASIIIACFTIYNTMSSSLNPVILAQGIYFTLISMIHLAIFTYFGIKVNTAAHSPLDVLHSLEGSNLTNRVIGLVTLFANKLSQSQIGISVLGLMVITKETVLSLTGTLLTYVFIAIQFKPDTAGSTQHSGNATSDSMQ